MRLALFSGNYNYLREGANQALNRLVGYLESRAGYQVRVYSPVTDTPAFEPAGTLVPVPSVTLPMRDEFQLALGLPSEIRDDIRSFAPDLIHVSTPDILNTRAQTFAKQMGIPIIASMHTQFETYLDYYRLGWLRPLAQAHLNRFYRRCDHVVAPTPALVADMKRVRGDDRVSVWSRGVDRTLFDPARRDRGWRRSVGIADHDIVILFFGRLVLEKGIDTFVEVVEALQRRPLPVRALIVGAGPASARFDSLADAVMAGHLEGVDLARAVASADMLLTPSTTETFGNIILEAMASGLPVISADAPNARALVEEGETGVLCPPRDIGAYVERIAGLIAAPETRGEMGAAARRASAAFSWDAASESVLRAYESICAGSY